MYNFPRVGKGTTTATDAAPALRLAGLTKRYGALSAVSVFAVGLIVAGWMKTIYELLTVGVFPFFVLMFFSESMFPLPKITLLHFGAHSFYANDILPTALTVKAFNKILNFQAGIADIGFELIAIFVETVLFLLLGLWLFRRRHLRPR